MEITGEVLQSGIDEWSCVEVQEHRREEQWIRKVLFKVKCEHDLRYGWDEIIYSYNIPGVLSIMTIKGTQMPKCN